MKKLLLTLLVFTILIVAISVIALLIVPDSPSEYLTTTTLAPTAEGYSSIDNGSNYQAFAINRELDSNFSMNFEEHIIEYSDGILKINDIDICSDVILNRNFALYNERLLVLSCNLKASFKSYIIIYDLYNNEFEIIDSIEDRFVSIDDNLIFEDIGFAFDTRIVDDDRIYVNNSDYDICSFDYAGDTIVIANVQYIYDMNSKSFNDYEIVSSLDYEAYKASNQLC